MLVWYLTELTTGLPGILDIWTLRKIWDWGVVTSSKVSLIAVDFDNSSCFLKLSIAMLTILLTILITDI